MKWRDLGIYVGTLVTFGVYEVGAYYAFGHVVDRSNDAVMAMGITIICAIRERRA